MSDDNLKTWPEKIYFPNIPHRLYCGQVNCTESGFEIEYIRADLVITEVYRILDDLRVTKEKDKFFAVAVPLRIADEREKKLIMACFDYCNTPIPSDRQIYADAGIDELIDISVVKESFTPDPSDDFLLDFFTSRLD